MSRQRLVSLLLVLVGLVNAFPLIGIASADALGRLYGIAAPEGDLLILLRHRALLFGLLGAYIALAAFRRQLQPAAIVAGLVSMLGFVGLALAAGEFGPEIRKVVLVDVVASFALLSAVLLRRRESALS